jgi:class 3 adenylate cyclase/DNA-binding SARP family transcriptional activator/tetratricopeptide (TPR) repeat protein
VAAPLGDARHLAPARLRAQLLGPFAITMGEKKAGPWARPPARRICELVLISRGRRVGRTEAIDALFPQLGPDEGRQALSQCLSYARAALAPLGATAWGLLQADRAHIWAYPATELEVDLELHEEALRLGLAASPGLDRDQRLSSALEQDGVLMADEPDADWAARPRERLEWARQEARLTLARDRSRGFGRSGPEAVVRAWEACLQSDPTSEEAATALMRVYGAQRRHNMVNSTYKRCLDALSELGLAVSPALGELRGSFDTAGPAQSGQSSGPPPDRNSVYAPNGSYRFHRSERRLVSVLFVELTGSLAAGAGLGLEEIQRLLRVALADVVGQVEAFGGTVTSISGAGLVALFGAPSAHEDDPERAARAALSAVAGTTAGPGRFSVRAGIETGECVVGPLLPGTPHYGAVGDAVRTSAALQSGAKPSSVLVGPCTREATETLFVWGPSEEVSVQPGTKPLVASYLEGPRARPEGQAGRRRLAWSARLVGREAEVGTLRGAVRDATAGRGGVVVIASEPGLGKTRLVNECRRLFMSWVGSGSGRLPLWLEGRAASYAASQPYGLYRQLLSAWLGVAPEEGDDAVRMALERAGRAVFAESVEQERVNLLMAVVSTAPVMQPGPAAVGLDPEQLQRATFRALRDLVARLVAYGPTVLALEDLHWADRTSLLVTRDLAALTAEAPLLLVLTRRLEPDPGVSALEDALSREPLLSLHTLLLGSLPEPDERQLARALLDERASDEVLDALTDGSDGNPLFLEERMASLLETRALVRVENVGWRLDKSVPAEVPAVIDRLVRSRVDRLADSARAVLVASSVLGPEFSLSALAAVTGLDGTLVEAVDDLCSAGLLVEISQIPQPAYRFRHALLQEATYKMLMREERQRLHGRAAWGLEASAVGRQEDMAAVLGHHFAMAGEADRAAFHLDLAGDHAAKAFANDEAVASYRYALDVLSGTPAPPAERQAPSAERVVEIWLKLAGVYERMARISEARSALEEAAAAAPEGSSVLAARCYCRLGLLEANHHQLAEGLAWFNRADELLGQDLSDIADDFVQTWLDVQLGLFGLYYWQFDPARSAEVIARAQPVLESRGTPGQRAIFLNAIANQRAQASHYAVDEETVGYVRAAWEAAIEGGLSDEFYWLRFEYAFMLLWHGDLRGAKRELGAALDLTQRAGDKTTEMRALVYLAYCHLQLGDVEATGEVATRSELLASDLEFPEYVGAAKAIRSWVAWRAGRTDQARALAREALGCWETGVIAYPFRWPALFPLLEMDLGVGDLASAIGVAGQLVQPGQYILRGGIGQILEAARAHWERGEEAAAAEALTSAVALALEVSYGRTGAQARFGAGAGEWTTVP